MKKNTIILSATVAGFVAMLFCGCSLKTVPDGWYKETLEYYSTGFESGWANEDPKLHISEEMKGPDNHFGYLLRDLDGDGADELLIGIIDDSEETRFTDLYIWHRDFGAFRSLNCGDGYYMYLDDDNVIRMDSWYGSATKTEYMIYDSDDNSFLIVDGGGKPGKYELTEF